MLFVCRVSALWEHRCVKDLDEPELIKYRLFQIVMQQVDYIQNDRNDIMLLHVQK